jgi:YD repeat-containing protein
LRNTRSALKEPKRETKWLSASGTLLKRVTPAWTIPSVEPNGQPNNPRVSWVTTYSGALQSTKTMSYDADGYLTQETLTDWSISGSGPSLLQKTRTYTPATGAVKRVASELLTAIDPVSGQTQVQGKTEYVYGEYGLVMRSGVPNGGTAGCFHQPSTIRRYKDGTNYVADHFKCDSVGNVIKKIDGLNPFDTDRLHG